MMGINLEAVSLCIDQFSNNPMIVYSKKSVKEQFKQIGIDVDIKKDKFSIKKNRFSIRKRDVFVPVHSGGYATSTLLSVLNSFINKTEYTIFYLNCTLDTLYKLIKEIRSAIY